MALILALETSTARCSVAIGDAEQVRAYLESDGKDNRHAAEITSLIANAMREAAITWSDLSAVAVSTGPGSFTGLRVGAAAAKGICFAHDLPLIGISTLQGMAHHAHLLGPKKGDLYLAMIHARKQEYYLSAYDEKLEEILAPQVLQVTEESLAELAGGAQKVVLVGSDLEKLNILDCPMEVKSIEASAALLCPLAHLHYKSGQFINVEDFTPTYLKDPYITVSKKRI